MSAIGLGLTGCGLFYKPLAGLDSQLLLQLPLGAAHAVSVADERQNGPGSLPLVGGIEFSLANSDLNTVAVHYEKSCGRNYPEHAARFIAPPIRVPAGTFGKRACSSSTLEGSRIVDVIALSDSRFRVEARRFLNQRPKSR